MKEIFFCWCDQWDYVERTYYLQVSVLVPFLVFSHVFCIPNRPLYMRNHIARNTISFEGITYRMAQSIKLHKSLIQFIPQTSTFCMYYTWILLIVCGNAWSPSHSRDFSTKQHTNKSCSCPYMVSRLYFSNLNTVRLSMLRGQ